MVQCLESFYVVNNLHEGCDAQGFMVVRRLLFQDGERTEERKINARRRIGAPLDGFRTT